MDILILVVLFAIAIAMYRGAGRGLIIGLWVVALLAVIGLFRFHVTSGLDLSF